LHSPRRLGGGHKLQALRPIRERTQTVKGTEPYCLIPNTTNTWGWVCTHSLVACPLGQVQVAWCTQLSTCTQFPSRCTWLGGHMPFTGLPLREGSLIFPSLTFGTDGRSTSRGLEVLPPEDRNGPLLCRTSRTPSAIHRDLWNSHCHLAGPPLSLPADYHSMWFSSPPVRPTCGTGPSPAPLLSVSWKLHLQNLASHLALTRNDKVQ
jgi:hypothetical protein